MPDQHLEALLSARLFLEPQMAGGRVYFMSNLGGHLSLYAMDGEGSVPEPLLPATRAMQNPDLVEGESFVVMPGIGRILVALDQDGDERYLPYLIPLGGGFPEPLAPETFGGVRNVHVAGVNHAGNVAYLVAESVEESLGTVYRVDVANGEAQALGASAWVPAPLAWTTDNERLFAIEPYALGDHVMIEMGGNGRVRTLWGTRLDDRDPGEDHPLSGFTAAAMAPSGAALLVVTALFDDAFSIAHLALDGSGSLEPVEIAGSVHTGAGELDLLERLGDGDRYLVGYNIDGCSWLYLGRLDEGRRRMSLDRVLCGQGPLADGELHGIHFDEDSGGFAASFCTATDPTQLYVIDADPAIAPRRITNERPLGLDPSLLAVGEDASFESHDGLRVSARLYLPSERLGFAGPRPVVLYIHGGPQSQERPNFAWFSMPLVQYLTLRGFAVFVPNVRGSTGYGLGYAKRVDGDWGGLDRLDHVWAMTEVLPKDDRLDPARAAVVGRSYGGYMALTLAGRHPELWSAACDMFGPYDLFTFLDRLPETWKPYFTLAVGDPERDRDLLVDRSPATHLGALSCPLLVIQGANDPRVVEAESADLVARLRAEGKDVEYLAFADEGHDVLKLANRVRCYSAIVDFFARRLEP